VSERSQAVQESHQHQQDSLENLRSLLLIISTRPKVKDDLQLASDLDKATASVVALCEASDDDPARGALEEFLTDYSRLQDEQETYDKQLAMLTADIEDLKRANAQLEVKIAQGTGDATYAIGHSEGGEQLEHVTAELRASKAELKALHAANESLRRDLQSALDNIEGNTDEALAMKTEDLERVLRNQDKVIEEHKKADNARDEERKRLEDEMDQLQLKNLALLETIAEMDEKFQQTPAKKHPEVEEDLKQLKLQMKEKEEEHDKEIKANEEMIGEMKAVMLKLEGSKGKYREQEEEHQKDLTDKNVTILELHDVIDKLEQANTSLLDELEALKLEQGVDHHHDFETRIGRLEKENDELRRANERLKIDLDQVALEIDSKPQTPTSSSSWTSSDVPLSEYTAKIRQKLQELKTSSFDETSRLREDNSRLKGELECVQRLGSGQVKDGSSDSDDDVEAKVVSQAAVHVNQALPSSLLNSELEDLRVENVEQKAELVVLKHRLAEMDSKHKKTSDAIADLERKNRELTGRLQDQETRGNGVNHDEMLEVRHRQLEAEVAELTRRLQQERSERLAQDLVDGRLGNRGALEQEKEEEIRQLSEDNRTLRKRLRTLEDRLNDSQNGDNGGDVTDNNNNSEVSRLRKQLEVTSLVMLR
jgi:chromosome segregation ATPase